MGKAGEGIAGGKGGSPWDIQAHAACCRRHEPSPMGGRWVGWESWGWQNLGVGPMVLQPCQKHGPQQCVGGKDEGGRHETCRGVGKFQVHNSTGNLGCETWEACRMGCVYTRGTCEPMCVRQSGEGVLCHATCVGSCCIWQKGLGIQEQQEGTRS